MQRQPGTLRRDPAPKPIHKLVDRDRSAEVDEQRRQYRALSGVSEPDRPPLAVGLHRPEYPKSHYPARPDPLSADHPESTGTREAAKPPYAAYPYRTAAAIAADLVRVARELRIHIFRQVLFNRRPAW
ncbi:hypothetical protein ACQEVC_35295 [Plantactinospora sp. CA-294935]|uniref:hypothetical protein n=1 Tax=Plantactinospora sp. CA-294935 TaxID=3240012 RepID=UPI003D8E9292